MSTTSDGRDSNLMDFDSAAGDEPISAGKRKFNESELMESLKNLTEEQIQQIIGITKKYSTDKSNQTKNLSTSEVDKDNQGFTTVVYKHRKKSPPQKEQAIPQTTVHKNYSDKMREIKNKEYAYLFYINTATSINTRIQMADIWNIARPTNKDVILKTKKGFLLKSDSPKVILVNTLKLLQKHEKILSFVETTAYQTNNKEKTIPKQTYSCVITSLEKEISDDAIAEHLQNSHLEFHYCKRIISRATNQPTHFVRIITFNIGTYETLLTQGLFYKSRHYAVYTSSPPPPAPIPCSKCLKFTHVTVDCTEPVKCSKCGENHTTDKCKTTLLPKCSSCGSEDHQAWSFKCPKRPTRPIEGIPNLPVKTLNRKSSEIQDQAKTETRIHSPVTVHDMIVNTYVNKLNKPKNSNREELIEKLRKKFIIEYRIETSVTFVGNNWIYILMFDMELEDFNSPTEILPGKNNVQVRTST